MSTEKKVTVHMRDGTVHRTTTDDADRYWDELPFTNEDVLYTRITESKEDE